MDSNAAVLDAISKDFWILRPADEPPGALFSYPLLWAKMGADEIGRSRRICIRCEKWCWVPTQDREEARAELFKLGWSLIARNWYCPGCEPDGGRPLVSEMKKDLPAAPHLLPATNFTGGANGGI